MKVAVTWEVCGYVDIPEAKTVEEAMSIFEKESDHIKLPRDGEYVDGSFQLSTDDVEEMEAMVNQGGTDIVNVKTFIKNLDSNDIDLVDKLDNLSGSGDISEDVCELAEEHMKDIENHIKAILQNQTDEPELTERYIQFIEEETSDLYEQGLINEADDYTGGLYNCDGLYLRAISQVLRIDRSELADYEE